MSYTVRLDAIETALDWIGDHAGQPPVNRFGLRYVSTAIFRYAIWYRLFEEERFVQDQNRLDQHALICVVICQVGRGERTPCPSAAASARSGRGEW